MLPSAILTIAPSSRRAPALVVTHATSADTSATGDYLRDTVPEDAPDDSADAHQAVTEPGPRTAPARGVAAPATSALHRCRRLHV
ncbi:hypothetical protein [Herbidospora daliensis]|uniref:hypothetical protein n=1 Tax=Herbidospora daliensis TaxID=295585 RepID=UPI0007826AAE|nr:hypothetical protein [Herbidospora daliensis]